MGGHVGDDDNQEVNEREKFTLLSNIAMNWQQLQVGGALLPDLVEFYAWLHKNLAHMLTFERASTICIGRVISLIEKNRGPDLGKHIRSLYESVKEKFNHYVDLIGGAIGAGACAAVHRENEITKISDEVPILHFLSGKFYSLVNGQLKLIFLATPAGWQQIYHRINPLHCRFRRGKPRQ